MTQRTLDNFVAVPVFNQLVPDEGPKSVSIQMDFDGIDEYNLSLLYQIESEKISAVQTIYFDNSLQPEDVDVVMSTTGQRITLPGLTQGYLPALVDGQGEMQFNCVSGTAVFKAILLNVPMAPYIWDADNR